MTSYLLALAHKNWQMFIGITFYFMHWHFLPWITRKGSFNVHFPFGPFPLIIIHSKDMCLWVLSNLKSREDNPIFQGKEQTYNKTKKASKTLSQSGQNHSTHKQQQFERVNKEEICNKTWVPRTCGYTPTKRQGEHSLVALVLEGMNVKKSAKSNCTVQPIVYSVKSGLHKWRF